MLLFISNVNPTELLLIAIVAVLVFGRRLPEVTGQAAGHLQRARKALADLRKQSGLDDEIREARRAFREADPRRISEVVKPTRSADVVARTKTPILSAPEEPLAQPPASQGAAAIAAVQPAPTESRPADDEREAESSASRTPPG